MAFRKDKPNYVSWFYGTGTTPILGYSDFEVFARSADAGDSAGGFSTVVAAVAEVGHGWYEVLLDLPGDKIDVLVKDLDGEVIHSQAYYTDVDPWAIAEDAATLAEQQAFWNAIADTILRRGQCAVEQSAFGDSKSINSLLGVTSLLTMGQEIQGPDSSGCYWIPVKSACNCEAPIGFLRVKKDKNGRITAIGNSACGTCTPAPCSTPTYSSSPCNCG